MFARERTQRLSRPSGTDGVSRPRQTSDKSLGYGRMSLRDKGPEGIEDSRIDQRQPVFHPCVLHCCVRSSGWSTRTFSFGSVASRSGKS
jgi:hypothetical protein